MAIVRRRERKTRVGGLLAAFAAGLLLAASASNAAASGGISGRVTGPAGEPLPGVEVQAYVVIIYPPMRDMFAKFPDRSGYTASTLTGADGGYEFTGLEPTPRPECGESKGYYFLLFSPPLETGFAPHVYRRRATPSIGPGWLTVEEGKVLSGIDVRLGPPASIAGTVLDADGAPIAGATVEAAYWVYPWPSTFFCPWRTTTDERGRYVLTHLDDNEYYLRVTTPGPSSAQVFYPGTADPEPVNPIPGERTGGYDIVVQPPGSIQVDGPAGYIGVWGLQSGPEGHQANPLYLPPGNYRVGMTPPTGGAWTFYPGTFQPEEAFPVVVRSGEVTSINLAPAPAGFAEGRAIDAAGAPVVDVAVAVSPRYGCPPPQVATTGADGRFSVAGSGDQLISFSKEGLSTVWFSGTPDRNSADLVRFRSGETIALPDVVVSSLGAPGRIAGRVTAGGAPTAGANVEIWASPAGTAALKTIVPGADGFFESDPLTPGAYLVRFLDTTPGSSFGPTWHPEAVSPATATPVVVEPGLSTTGIDADLQAVGSVAGTVTLNHQPLLPFEPARVCLADRAGNQVRCVDSTSPGVYGFTAVAPGQYLVAFDTTLRYSFGRWYPDRDTAATAEAVVVAPGTAITNLDLDIPRVGIIQGNVSITPGSPHVYGVDADSGRVVWRSDVDSPFRFGIAPGRYRLLFMTHQFNSHPQWYPGKRSMPEAQIVEILPGQVISGIDVTMEPWWENHPPSLPGAGNLAATEGVDASFTLAADDPDGDLLTFSAAGLPPGATFDQYTGTFSWTPTCSQEGVYPPISFTVTDHGNPPRSASLTMPVTVAGRACPPVLEPIGERSVIAGETLGFQITAADPEGDPLALGATGLPAGATFNPADGTFAWRPTTAQIGTYQVTFAAYDQADPSSRDEEVVSITVAGPLLFHDDFSRGGLPADPGWTTAAGAWSVRAGVFHSAPTGISIALAGVAAPAGDGLAAGRIRARIRLAKSAPGTPNLMFIFGYRDPLHYRYVRFLPGATEIGQVGDLPGQPAVRTRKRAGIVAGRWQQTRVDFHPDGRARVYRGNVALAAMRFAAAEPGRVGVGARNSHGVVDEFNVWGRTVLN